MSRLLLAVFLVSACAGSKPATKPAPVARRPPPSTEPAQRVALLQLKPAGPSSEQLAETLGQLVAFELEDTGRFKVLSREDLSDALKLKGIQQGLGCDTESCEADLARAADVQQIVTGSLGKLGDTFVLVLRLVDSKEVRVVRQARDTAAGREEDLMAAAQRTSWTIAGLEVEKPSEAVQQQDEDSSDTGPSEGETAVANDVVRSALGGFTQGLRSAVPGLGMVDAVLPRLTADLEASLASSLAARLTERQRRKTAPRTP